MKTGLGLMGSGPIQRVIALANVSLAVREVLLQNWMYLSDFGQTLQAS
jgi:hypothetical protein